MFNCLKCNNKDSRIKEEGNIMNKTKNLYSGKIFLSSNFFSGKAIVTFIQFYVL
jgi:hypothetical protein